MSWMLSIWTAAALLALCGGQGYSLCASGYHLCLHNETKSVSFLVMQMVSYTEAKPCGGWLPWKTCTVTLYKMIPKTENKTVVMQVAKCCDGYVQVGRYCALPVNRSGEFTAKPGTCPTADGLYPGSEDCEWDMDCPGWQKCCQKLRRSRCAHPESSANDSYIGGYRLNVTVTVKVDYQELMSKDNGLLNHTRLLQAMVTGALPTDDISVYYLSSWPVHPYRTATSLLIGRNSSLSLSDVSSKLHLLLKHIPEVSSVTVEDVDECVESTFPQCSPQADCNNTVGSYQCICRQGYSDVDPSNPGAYCTRDELWTDTETPVTDAPSVNTDYTPASDNSSDISMTTVLNYPSSISYDSSHAALWTSTAPYTSTESPLPTTTCSPPNITSLMWSNVTGTSFDVYWSGQSQTNQTYRVVLSKGSVVTDSWETDETVKALRGLEPGVLYNVAVTPHACGRQGVALAILVKTDCQTLDATARITNVEFTPELQNSSSEAYMNLTRSIEEEIYESLSPEMKAMVDSGLVRIEITNFLRGSVVVNFKIVVSPSQSHNISNVSIALLNSLMNSSKYTVDENNTSINDSDECTSGSHDCSQWANCTNTWGSYTCVCKTGYTDNNPDRPGRVCTSISTSETITPSVTPTLSSTVSTVISLMTQSTSDPVLTPTTTTTNPPTSTTANTDRRSIITAPITTTAAPVTTTTAPVTTTTITIPQVITTATPIPTTSDTTTITTNPITTTTAPLTTTAAPVTITTTPITTTTANTSPVTVTTTPITTTTANTAPVTVTTTPITTTTANTSPVTVTTTPITTTTANTAPVTVTTTPITTTTANTSPVTVTTTPITTTTANTAPVTVTTTPITTTTANTAPVTVTTTPITTTTANTSPVTVTTTPITTTTANTAPVTVTTTPITTTTANTAPVTVTTTPITTTTANTAPVTVTTTPITTTTANTSPVTVTTTPITTTTANTAPVTVTTTPITTTTANTSPVTVTTTPITTTTANTAPVTVTTTPITTTTANTSPVTVTTTPITTTTANTAPVTVTTTPITTTTANTAPVTVTTIPITTTTANTSPVTVTTTPITTTTANTAPVTVTTTPITTTTVNTAPVTVTTTPITTTTVNTAPVTATTTPITTTTVNTAPVTVTTTPITTTTANTSPVTVTTTPITTTTANTAPVTVTTTPITTPAANTAPVTVTTTPITTTTVNTAPVTVTTTPITTTTVNTAPVTVTTTPITTTTVNTAPVTVTTTPITTTTVPITTSTAPVTTTTTPVSTTTAAPVATTTTPITTTTTTTTTLSLTTTSAPPILTTTAMTSITSSPSTNITTTTNVRRTTSMSGDISVRCRGTDITVTVARDFLQDHKVRESDLYLGLPECGVNGGNTTHAQLNVAWGECDTRLVQNETCYTASVTLFNTMANDREEAPTVQLELPVMCTYRKDMVISADSGSTGYDMIKEVIVGLGSFQVRVQLMNGTATLPNNYSLSAEERVVVEVSLNTSSERIKVVINKCWATSTPSPADPQGVTFLENGCPLNSFTEVLSNGNSSTSRVSVQIFSIVEQNVIYLHCQVQICVQIGSDTCVPDCQQRTARSSRTVASSVSSAGPLFKLFQQSFEQEYETAHIIGFACLGVGLSLFFIIAFVCLFYYQRNRIGHYNFNVKPKQETFTYLNFNT
ncbi:uromodulin-like 1 isoform X2 [Solea solea]|uniref:uromodulin-like 1 isoform X2 n=1 Tax=Solea solea TaxID=90069 RepID=UPI00272CEA2E|nr:uromodulin-like 1 isoform X2 [Solea solea]